MPTAGTADVCNPLLFGLNPSLCLTLCLSVKRQEGLTHLCSASQPGCKKKKKEKSQAGSQETEKLKHPSASPVPQIIPDGAISWLRRIRSILPEPSNDPSYRFFPGFSLAGKNQVAFIRAAALDFGSIKWQRNMKNDLFK